MNSIYVILGIVIGYCMWNIIHIFKTEKKIKKFNTLMNSLKSTIGTPPNLDDPITTVHHTLTKLLKFPESKAILYNNDNALAIAYGHSSVVIIDRPASSAIAIGIGVDKTTNQPKEERDQEFQELKQLLESCNFEGENFSESLALLVNKLSHADLTKFTHVHRQIPRDML
jgi:hypothetical protein